ncbi:MAG: O-antigen ligase family protein [Gemmatimonadaceae bacterium]
MARGWRSARAYVQPGVAQAPPTAAPEVDGRTAQRLTSRPSDTQSVAPPDSETFVWPWKGVKWNVAFIGFCAYTIATITYVAPIGQPGMIIALLGLLFGSDRVRFPLPLIFFGLYYALAISTYPLSPHPAFVKRELEDMARVGLIFLVGMNVLMERTRLRFYLFLYLGAFGLYPVRGAIFNQFIYHAAELGRIAWNQTFENPNDLAAFLLVPMGLTIGMFYTEKQRYIRYAALLGVSLIALIVFMTQSRGAIVALVVFGLVALARSKKRLKMLPALIVMGMLVGFFAPNSVWTRLRNLKAATGSGELKAADDMGSAEQRYEIWKVAGRIFSERPLTGVGLGAYAVEHWRIARSGAENFKRTARGGRDAHSTYLRVLAELGIPGLVLFMGIFVSVYVYAQRTRKKIKHTDPGAERQIFFAQVAFLSVGIAAIFGSWAHIPFMYMNVAILYGICYVVLQKQRERQATFAMRRFS